MVHHSSSYGNFLHNLRLLASLVKKSGVLFISVAITMIVFVFTLLFSLESILEQLSYVITQALKLLSQYLPVQNKIILGDTLGTSATGLFVFISAILSAVFTISLIRYKRILIPSLLSMVLLVPCFILVNTLPSLVCLLLQLQVLLPCTFQRTHANSDRHRAV